MKLPPIASWPLAPLFIPGLIFLLVNTSASYRFYHVNSYKIVLIIIGVSILAIRNLPLFPSKISPLIPWRIWLFLAIPVLATLPGLIWHQFGYNYNFRYELATNLILIVWAIYLFRSIRQEDDISLFLFFIGIAIVFNGCWSLLERSGLHPLAWQEPVRLVKATFGHRNYFSGFLIVLLPVMLMFAIPGPAIGADRGKSHRPRHPGVYTFFIAVFVFGCISLFLAQTRAAIAAFAISLAVVCYLYVHFFCPKQWRKWILIIYGILLLAGICMVAAFLLLPDFFHGSRFAQLLTIRAWMGRWLAWETAFHAIKSSPLVGYGLGSSYNLFFSFVDPDARLFHFEHSYNHAHSEILEYIQEAGLFGLAVYILFWAWLVRRLIGLMKKPDLSSASLKLLIGICGGFLAYHIHGSFSVAPRMMVTKLPVFTLIALLLSIDNLQTNPNQAGNEQPTLRRRLLSGLPTLAALLCTWTIFLPWAAGQWQFNKIRQERPPYLQIRKLEALIALVPDIYALDHLSRRQIEYKQTGNLRHTLDLTGSMIPHYRDLGYKKTLAAVLTGNLEQAKAAGLRAQERDRYHQPTIELMMNLAVKTNDLPMFKSQFSLLLRMQVFENRMVESLDADAVVNQYIPGENLFNVVDSSKKLSFQWSEKLLGILFETARKNHERAGASLTEQARYRVYLKKLISRHPWFQLNVLKQHTGNSQSLAKSAKAYQLLKKEWKNRKGILEQGYQAELGKTPPGKRRDVYRLQQQALSKVQQSYFEQLNELAIPLREKTDWDLFIRKQKFVESFTGRLARIIFPKGA